MSGKRVFYCELSYVLGIVVLAFGTSLMEKADFGLSMVVAPAYLVYLVVSRFLPFFTFGMSEYLFQAALLVPLCLIMGRIKKSYLLSFATAFVYGLVLDGFMSITALLPCETMALRTLFFVVGLCTGSVGVALFFNTYFPPEVYELFVKELAEKLGMEIGKIKTIYDCCSCALGILLSLCFFGSFVGVKAGTIVCALVNGRLIGGVNRWLQNHFVFADALPLRQKLK